MRTIVSNKQNWFNKINLTKDDEIYIGIDVHKISHHIAIWLNDAPAIDFVMPADNQKVLTMLEKLRIALKQVVYEASPHFQSGLFPIREKKRHFFVQAQNKTRTDGRKKRSNTRR